MGGLLLTPRYPICWQFRMEQWSLQAFCPEGAFCVGRAKKIDVRASVRSSVPPFLCHAFLSRSIFEKSANLWQVIDRILDSNLIYYAKIRHPWICDDLVLRTQKVALGPPLPCGCNLVREFEICSHRGGTANCWTFGEVSKEREALSYDLVFSS